MTMVTENVLHLESHGQMVGGLSCKNVWPMHCTIESLQVQSTLPNSKAFSSPLFFIFYCFLTHMSPIFSKSKVFHQSQWIRLRQS